MNHYTLKRSTLASEKSIDSPSMIKLNNNEFPYEHADSVKMCLENNKKLLSHYPDDDCMELKKKIADQFSIPLDNLLITAGSSEAIALAIMSYSNSYSNIITSTHAFQLYSSFAKQQKKNIVLIDETKLWDQNLEGILDSINDSTSLIFISNPSNPIGTWINDDQLVLFLQAVPNHIHIVIDEAYFEFMCDKDTYKSAIHLLEKHQNIIITRTFSKLYGLASIRVGYVVASPDRIKHIKLHKLPFSVSTLAINSGVSVLKEYNYYLHCRNNIILTRNQLYHKLSLLGYTPIANTANFLTFKFGINLPSLLNALKKKNIFVGELLAYNLPEFIRVSIGTDEEIKWFIEVFQYCVDQFCTEN